jgi:hypothetical protein
MSGGQMPELWSKDAPGGFLSSPVIREEEIRGRKKAVVIFG